MKKINIKVAAVFASLALLAANGCKKSFLDSNQLSQYSPNDLNHVDALVCVLNALGRATRGEFPVGVHYEKSRGKFQAYIRVYGKRKHLGRFDTPEEAFNTYKQAKEAYIKEVANKWKDKIDQRVYEALMNWVVSIDD